MSFPFPDVVRFSDGPVFRAGLPASGPACRRKPSGSPGTGFVPQRTPNGFPGSSGSSPGDVPPVRSSGPRGSLARPVRPLRNCPAGAEGGPSQAASCHLRLEMSKGIGMGGRPFPPGGRGHRGFPQWGHRFLPAFDFCISSTKPAPMMPVGRANIPIPKTALTAPKNFPQKVTGYTSP